MLNHTSTSGGTSSLESRWDGKRERSLISRNTLRVIPKVIIVDKHVSDNSIGRCVDDGNIGGTSVGSSDIEFEIDDLTSCP